MPIWSDLSTFDPPTADLVCAGFPCQPWSVAGRQRGQEDPRHLWPHVARILRDSRANTVLLENVPGLLSEDGLGEVLEALCALGFNAEWGLFTSRADGAPHIRRRWFLLGATDAGRELLREQQGRSSGEDWPRAPQSGVDGTAQRVADANGRGQQEQPQRDGRTVGGPEGQAQQRDNAVRLRDDVADPVGTGPQVGQGQRGNSCEELPAPLRDGWWSAEPSMGRVADGAPYRVDRLRALGNGVVPRTVRRAYLTLRERILDHV